MPRKKEDRNPFGTILEKTVEKDGKKIKVWDVRKRYALTDAEGNFVLDEKNKKIYKDKTQRCYSKSEANTALMSMPAKVAEKQEKKDKKQLPETAKSRTFFELAEYFRATYCKPAVIVGKKQVTGYRQNVKNLETQLDAFKEFFGDIRLDEMTYEHVRAFAEQLATTPIKPRNKQKTPVGEKLPQPATVNRKLATLRRLFNIGRRLKWMHSNPFNEGESLIDVKAERERTRVLTFEEERVLIETCELDRVEINKERSGKPLKMIFANPWKKMKFILILAIDTGLRRKEIFSLLRKDVDLEKKLIFLPAPKTKSLKDRVIPISKRLEDEFIKHFAAHSFQPQDPIFFGQQDCKKAFGKLCAYCGIEDLHFHDLRHTATTWMSEAGIPSETKKNVVGHSSDAVHQRYNNTSDDVFAAFRQKLDSFAKKKERLKKKRGTA